MFGIYNVVAYWITRYSLFIARSTEKVKYN